MTRIPIFVGLLILALTTGVLTSCSRDPNVRKQKYFESGERYFAKAKYSAAAIQFANAVQVDSHFAAAHYQLARTYLQLQDWPNAYKELDRTVELDPENYPARLDLANLLIAGGELKKAKEQVDLLSLRQPDDSPVHIVKANLSAAQHDFPTAVQEVQKAIVRDPGRGELYRNLALLQIKTDQADAAEVSFKKSIELAPKVMNTYLELGSYYQLHQRFTEAEQQFDIAMKVERQSPDPRIALARLYVAEGKKAAAEGFLKESKKDFPNDSVGYRLLGDFYFAAGDFDRATAEYSNLNRDHPKDAQVMKNYVQLLIIKNRWDEARKLNDAVLKVRPYDVDSLIERAQIQIGEGNPSDAVQTLQTAIKNEPRSGLAYYHLGRAFEGTGNTIQAGSAWQNAIRYRPDLVEAQRALANLALHQANMSELERYSSQIINLQPASVDGYALRAFSYIQRGKFSRAQPDVLKAIEVGGSSPMGYVQMGNLMLAQKNYREAVRAYQQALERQSESSEALAGLMNAYLAQKQTSNTVAAAREQLNKVPNSSAFYDLLGTVLFEHKQSQRDLDEGEANLGKAVQLDKRNIDAWLKLTKAQAARSSLAEAIDTCQHALESNPREASLYVLLGQLYESKQGLDKAKEAYKKALDIDPNHPLASNNLAYLLLQTGGNPDLAMPLAQTARRAMPDSPDAADTLGWVFYQKGAYKSAVDFFQEALKLAEKGRLPDDPTTHFHLGLAYERMGQPALARQHLQRVLKINPNYSNAAEVKRLLLQLPG